MMTLMCEGSQGLCVSQDIWGFWVACLVSAGWPLLLGDASLLPSSPATQWGMPCSCLPAPSRCLPSAQAEKGTQSWSLAGAVGAPTQKREGREVLASRGPLSPPQCMSLSSLEAAQLQQVCA